jgi:hypothetical protein
MAEEEETYWERADTAEEERMKEDKRMWKDWEEEEKEWDALLAE